MRSFVLRCVAVFQFIPIPAEPLTPAEATVVVGACAVVVLSARGLWTRLHKRRKDNESVSLENSFSHLQRVAGGIYKPPSSSRSADAG